MNFSIKNIICLVLLFALQSAMARSKHDVAFLIRKPAHLKAAFLTLEQMRSGKFPLNYRKAVIVACGAQAVKALGPDGDFKKQLSTLKEKDLKVLACGLTLKKFGIKRESLHSGVSVVKNGLYEMIELKTKGYISVDI